MSWTNHDQLRLEALNVGEFTAGDAFGTSERQPTRKADRLIALGVQVASQPPTGEDMTFIHSTLCQLGLPRKKVDGTKFVRQCGKAALMITAGELWNGARFVQQPIPYGPKPRLILTWLNTYALRNNTPEIHVGDSASEFAKMLGLDTSGGKRGTFTAFTIQLRALAACSLTLGFDGTTCFGKPISRFEAWLPGREGQRPLWPGVVKFSEEYFQTLVQHAVPVDLRMYTALQGSSLAMDLYTMLAARLFRISGRPQMLYWANLREQFAQEYSGKHGNKSFKDEFLRALHQVKTVYPRANVQQVRGGILLFPSPPPIPA